MSAPTTKADAKSFLASGLGIALFSSAVFGTSGSFAKSMLETGWSPGAAVAVRLTGAALILVIPRRRGSPRPVAPTQGQLAHHPAVRLIGVAGVPALLLQCRGPIVRGRRAAA